MEEHKIMQALRGAHMPVKTRNRIDASWVDGTSQLPAGDCSLQVFR